MKSKTKLYEDLQILFKKMDEMDAEIGMTRDISKSMYRSLTEAMIVVESLSRLLVSKDIVSKKEIENKIKELNLERERINEKFRKSIEIEAHEEYLKQLLISGSYGSA